MGGKKSGNILNEDPSPVSEKSVGDPCELEEETGALSSFETGSASGDGEVLTGEASEEEVNATIGGRRSPRDFSEWISSLPIDLSFPYSCNAHVSYVLETGNSGPVSCEDFQSVGVLLALEDNVDSCSVHAEVEATDA